MMLSFTPEYQAIVSLVQHHYVLDAGHTMDHVLRVYTNAKTIAEQEQGVDIQVLTIAALMHDIARVREDADNTGQTDHATLGAEMSEDILATLGYRDDLVRKVSHCIAAHRFRSGLAPQSLGAQILYEADKIDMLGYIGIARSFMIAGEHQQSLFSTMPLDDYLTLNLVGAKAGGRIKDISKHTANLEFETKIRHIPKRFRTITGINIAKARLGVMEDFFQKMQCELEGRS
jgi:uncharacterized protein